jgi:hypothetical protein
MGDDPAGDVDGRLGDGRGAPPPEVTPRGWAKAES